MAYFDLSGQGFVTHWLVSGPGVTEPKTDIAEADQLVFERRLRGEIAREDGFVPPENAILGGEGIGGMPWAYWSAQGGWFVDKSTFYPLLCRAEMWACTGLMSSEEQNAECTVWTYAAADVYVNGARVLAATPPVYKPVKKQTFRLTLKKGENRIFVRLRTLGARDTRTILGFQLSEGMGVSVFLPDSESLSEALRAEKWLSGVRRQGGRLLAPGAPPCPVQVRNGGGSAWTEKDSFDLPAPSAPALLAVSVPGGDLARWFDIPAPVPPFDAETEESRRRERLFRTLGGPETVFPSLVRRLNGIRDESDEKIIAGFLDRIMSRADCSDFSLNALFRLFRRCDAGLALKSRFREAVLSFRYWMDEEGQDAMCFWSENHALLFFANQYLAGDMFPDETFLRSGLTGRRVRQRGALRCRQWLSSVLNNGFEEFCSSAYAPVTACALLSLIDFGPEDMARDARRVLDGMFRQLSLHVFDGMVIAPQGRVYRDVLTPWSQGTQALMNLALPGMRMQSSAWLGAFAMSGYRPPEDLTDIARRDRDMCYRCGKAEIYVFKRPEYMLTSCRSPRKLGGEWSSRAYTEEDPRRTGRFSYAYVRALNERFHGTTRFEPGTYGYQQHMMYAALKGGAISYVNHPGAPQDFSQLRPGYWNGNGVMPAALQEGARLMLIFALDGDHPVRFTHVYLPKARFDEVVSEDGFLFARKGDGYLSLWCSGPLVPFDGELTDCEYRCQSPRAAYVYRLGSRAEYGDFEAFRRFIASRRPAFDPESLMLEADGARLEYKKGHDDTQYLG